MGTFPANGHNLLFEKKLVQVVKLTLDHSQEWSSSNLSCSLTSKILYHTVWRTWLFIAYSDWKMIFEPILTTSLIRSGENWFKNRTFLNLGVERFLRSIVECTFTRSCYSGGFCTLTDSPAQHVFNPFTPESDQCQNSPATSQGIWHHTVWRTWLFIAYSDEKWLYYKFSLHHSYNRFLKGWENTLWVQEWKG